MLTVGNQALDHAQALMDDGLSLAEACGQIEPQYPAWGQPQQRLFRQAIQLALSQRRIESRK